MRKLIAFSILALSACSEATEEEQGRETKYDTPCLEYFASKNPNTRDIVVRDSYEKRAMVVVELAKPDAPANPALKGAVPDSPAAAKQAAVQKPAAAHCIVNPADGSMRLSSSFDHSWERDTP